MGKPKIENVRIDSLVFDDAIYPRGAVSSVHVAALSRALEAGATLPPILVDAKSRRVLDGWHRSRAHLAQFGDDAEIEAELRTYDSEAEAYLDAIQCNTRHGYRLSSYDFARIARRSAELGIAVERAAGALQLTPARLADIIECRTARTEDIEVEAVTVKRTFRHLAGRTLTPRQLEANERSSGMKQAFYVNQVLDIIEADAVEEKNAELVERLRRLADALERWLARNTAKAESVS